MYLSGEQRRTLVNAILSGYPSKQELARMVAYDLEKNLDSIAGGENLSDVVFNLVEWAGTHNCIRDLVHAAHKNNPQNVQIDELLTQSLKWVNTPANLNPTASRDRSQKNEDSLTRSSFSWQKAIRYWRTQRFFVTTILIASIVILVQIFSEHRTAVTLPMPLPETPSNDDNQILLLGSEHSLNETIIFHGFDDNRSYDIYTIRNDETDAVKLTKSPSSSYSMFPNWSPSGSHIAFGSNRFGNSEIFTMKPDGTQARRLTYSSTENWYPVWSPNNKMIAYVSNMQGNHDVFILDVENREFVQLTFTDAEDKDPSWSPDGSQIAFVSDRDGDHDIYLMSSNGENQRKLLDRPERDFHPAWSPDGKSITFASELTDTNWELFVYEFSSEELVRVTSNSADDRDPSWSPDGEMIVFTSNRSGDYEIYKMQRDGTAPQRITINETSDFNPEWISPFPLPTPITINPKLTSGPQEVRPSPTVFIPSDPTPASLD